jgi:hypothetical protein
MTGDVVDKIKRLTEEGMVHEVNGRHFSPVSMEPVFFDPRPSPLTINTLSGLIDYIKSNVDDVTLHKCLIHVADYAKVELLSGLYGEMNARDTFVTVRLDDMERFPFGQFIDPETFNIKLRSMFVENDDQERVLHYVSKIDLENSTVVQDDGVTQSVTLKKSAKGHLMDKTPEEAPAIVALKPYRTFPDIEQPVSRFLFRIQSDGARCALFEADGGKWKDAARQSIKTFLEHRLTDISDFIHVIA